MLEQCLFTNNTVIRSNGDSLSLIGTHSQLMACEFLGSAIPSFHRSTVNFGYGTSSINNCTFSEQNISPIGAYGSKLNITNSSFYACKGCCLYWVTSEITIVGSQFNADADKFLYNANMNWSSLTVINTSFMNGHSVFTSIFRSGQVQFINCSFHTGAGLVLGTGKTLLKNCTISNLKKQFILAGPLNQFPDLADPTGPAHLEIVDCVIIENHVSDDQPFIYVAGVSFVMTNCLYSGNYVRNHIMLNGTTDVTIKNVTFFNNSVGGYYDSENYMSLLTVTNTGMEIDNCRFENNNMQHGSLMLVFGSAVRVMNSVMSDNRNRNMISIHDSQTVEFSSSKFINNSNIDIFHVLSSTLLFIDSCLFVNNYGRVFDIRHTNDVFLQRSSFINPDSSDGSTDDVNNLRIFKCFSYHQTFKTG